jgi:hypothetical protein
MGVHNIIKMYRFPYFHTTLFSLVIFVVSVMLGIQSSVEGPLSHRLIPPTLAPTRPPTFYVDPFFMINGTNANDLVGQSLAFSDDGLTLAIGVIGYNSYHGAVMIYNRIDGLWTFQQLLSGNGTAGVTSSQGTQVKLNGDTVVFSGTTDNGNYGAIWVFVRVNGVWMQQGNKITGSSPVNAHPRLGASLALTNDMLAFGAVNEGTVWIFQRTDETWNEIQRLTNYVGCGTSLAMTEMNLMIGCDGTDEVLYYANGEGWNLVQTITGTGYSGSWRPNFGSAVSFVDDVLAVGALFDDDYDGSVYIFDQQNDGQWLQRGDKMSAVGCEQMGASLQISPNGEEMIVGCPHTDSFVGAYLLYTRLEDGSWYNVDGVQTAPGYIDVPHEGIAVAIADGVYAVSGINDNADRGKVWVITI